MLTKSLISTSLILILSPSFAKEYIYCKNGNEDSEAIITLSSFKLYKRVFNCISGEFVTDLSGCAPDGAFGLHAPTGSAALVGVVDRWQDYTSHLGGITNNFITDTTIHFSGGFNSPSSGYKEDWNFDLNRLTGKADLKRSSGKITAFSCKKSKKKI